MNQDLIRPKAAVNAGERAALQTLRAGQVTPAFAKRLDWACLQHRFSALLESLDRLMVEGPTNEQSL